MKITHNNTEFIKIKMAGKGRFYLQILIILIAILLLPAVWRNPVNLAIVAALTLIVAAFFLWYKYHPFWIIYQRDKETLYAGKEVFVMKNIHAVEMVYVQDMGVDSNRNNYKIVAKGIGYEQGRVIYQNPRSINEVEELYNFLERILPTHVKFKAYDSLA